MTRKAIERKLQGILVRTIGAALKSQDKDGNYQIPPQVNWLKIQYDHQIAAAMGWCLSHKFAGNPYYRSKKLAAAMERGMRCMMNKTRSTGVTGFSGMPMDHRALTSYIYAERHASGQMSPALARDLVKIFRETLDFIRERIKPYLNLRVFDAHSLQTGTNHFWGYLATMALLAHRLNEVPSLERYRPFAERFAKAQDPTGHWTENFGPATLYTRVSAQYMARATDILGGAPLEKAARMAADFLMKYSFPDGTAIECFDERMMHDEPFYRESQHVFGWNALPYHPQGPAFFAAMIDPMIEACEPPEGFRSLEFTVGLVEALERLEALTKPSQPWRTKDGSAHGDGFGTVRSGPWQVGYQVLPTRAWPANPFFLDRQNLFSLWNDRCGRMVNGSNSKRQPDVASFIVLERSSDEWMPSSDYLPLRGRWNKGGKLGAIAAVYRSFNAEIEFLPKNDRSLVARITTKPRRKIARLTFNVALPFRWGEFVSTGSARFQLVQDQPYHLTMPITQIGNGTVRFSSSRKFQATWPFIPFSSYHAPLNQKPARDAWFVASFTMDANRESSIDLLFDV